MPGDRPEAPPGPLHRVPCRRSPLFGPSPRTEQRTSTRAARRGKERACEEQARRHPPGSPHTAAHRAHHSRGTAAAERRRAEQRTRAPACPTPPTLSAPARSPYGFTVDAPTEVRAPTDLGTTQGKGRPTIPQALPRNTRPADGGGRGQPRAKRGWSTAVAGLGVQVCLSRLYSRISLLSSVVARMMSPRAARRSGRLLVVGSWAVSPWPTLISLTTW